MLHGQSPLVRQWILLKTLCARSCGATVKELVHELGVSEKTIRRDLETFQKVGFPLQEEVGGQGRKAWRIDPAKNQPGLSFAFDEAIALYLGRRLLEPLAGTVFGEAASRAFRKIRAVLSPGALKYLERFAGIFHQTMLGVSDYARKADLIDQLLLAIEDRRAVFITYQSLRATEPVSYDVYPYALVHHHNSLYLVGHAPEHDQIRHWKIDRIDAVDLTSIHFQRPEGFDLQQHFAKSFGIFHGEGDIPVKIRFSPAVARYVQEKHWHESQKLTKEPDGSLLAEFRLGSTEEIKSWVLGFGRHAEVLQPHSLRQEIREEAESLLRLMSSDMEPASSPARRPGEPSNIRKRRERP